MERRRLVLKGIWATPIVTAVVIPVHAQTSICALADLVGEWRFTFATHVVPALNPTFELFADGTTSDAASDWGITNNNEFFLRQDISDYSFIAPLSTDCDSLSGTSTTVFTEPPDNLPANGTWTAERV